MKVVRKILLFVFGFVFGACVYVLLMPIFPFVSGVEAARNEHEKKNQRFLDERVHQFATGR